MINLNITRFFTHKNLFKVRFKRSCLNLKNSCFEALKTNTWSNLSLKIFKSIQLSLQIKTFSTLAIKALKKNYDLVQSPKQRFQYNIKFGRKHHFYKNPSLRRLLLIIAVSIVVGVSNKVAWFKVHRTYLALLLLSLQNASYNTHVLYTINCKNYCWKFQPSLWKLSVKELFLNKVKVSRPANINDFLQNNFSRIKYQIKLVWCCANFFFSEYPLMVERWMPQQR